MFRSRRPSAVPSSQGGADEQAVIGEIVPPGAGTNPHDQDGRTVMARFIGVVARVPRYSRLGWALMHDQTVTGRGKAALGGGLAYAISPIEPVPGFIPVLGQLDDLAVLILAVRTALRSAPVEVADRHLADAGLSWAMIERDLLTLRATAIWVARRGGALAVRAGKAVMTMVANRLRGALPGRGPSGGAGRAVR